MRNILNVVIAFVVIFVIGIGVNYADKQLGMEPETITYKCYSNVAYSSYMGKESVLTISGKVVGCYENYDGKVILEIEE